MQIADCIVVVQSLASQHRLRTLRRVHVPQGMLWLLHVWPTAEVYIQPLTPGLPRLLQRNGHGPTQPQAAANMAARTDEDAPNGAGLGSPGLSAAILSRENPIPSELGS